MLERPALDQLRIDAKLKLWDAVLIYDPDRLARRGFYQELIIDELEHLGIRTLFVTMPPVANGEDRLMSNVRGAFAEYERQKIADGPCAAQFPRGREQNLQSFRNSLLQGRFFFHRLPFFACEHMPPRPARNALHPRTLRWRRHHLGTRIHDVTQRLELLA